MILPIAVLVLVALAALLIISVLRRREDANDRFAGNYVHTIPGTGARKPSPEEKRAGVPQQKKGKQKQSRRPAGKGYRPKG